MNDTQEVLKNDSKLPSLNGLQFDRDTKLVNLFRGSATFPIEILNLPGRNGLDYNLNLFYQSDFAKVKIDKWNIDDNQNVASEDIAGVGWGMPYERIIVSNNSNQTINDNQYYWVMSGQLTRLFPINRAWTLGMLPSSYESDLGLSYGTINESLQNGFRDQQIPLSANSTFTSLSTNSWKISDPDNEIIYALSQEQAGAPITIKSGGISFELYNYNYWQISYYPEFERWEVIKNDGNIYSFGGSGEEIDSGIAPNTQQYGVKWGNWIGPSSETNGQEHYTKAWNLAKVQNRLGNYFILNYVTENQAVGEITGLEYTKNCLVSKVKNDLGWSVEYKYKASVYDNISLEAPKEYIDPHSDPLLIPGLTPNAYQSVYLTKHLDELILYNASGEIENYTKFEYINFGTATTPNYLWNSGVLPTSASDQEKLAYGATFNRYLGSVTRYAGKSYGFEANLLDRYSSPGILLDYNFNDPTQPMGLLTKIISPEGGKTILEYHEKIAGTNASTDSRSLTIVNPFSATSSTPGIARTWSGNDYTVCCWYDDTNNRLLVNVFTWIGCWHKAFDEWMTLDYLLDIDRIQVIPSTDTFLLVLTSPINKINTNIYRFNRVKFQDASWICSDTNNPDIYKGNQISVYPGDNFFIILNNDASIVDRLSWDSLNNNWEPIASQTIASGETYYAAAFQNYYVLFAYDKLTQDGQFIYNGRDIYGNWTISKTLDTHLPIPGLDGFDYFQMSPSSSFVAISVVTGYTPRQSGGFHLFEYELNILSWDTDYTLQLIKMEDIQNISDGSFNNIPASVIKEPTGIGPVPINNMAIGTGPNYVYFNGVNWSCESLKIKDKGFKSPAQQYYWYAYDEQGVIKTENTDSGIISMIGNIDPSNPSSDWLSQTLLDSPGPIVDRYDQAYPTNAGQFFTIGNQVYAKPLGSGEWGTLSSQDFLNLQTDVLNQLSTLNESVDTTTFINTGNYLLFQILDENNSPKDVGIIYFKNGTYVTDTTTGSVILDRFSGQKVFSFFKPDHTYVSKINGKFAQTYGGVITYPTTATSLDETPFITLNQYSGESFEGMISGWVVKTVTYESGFDQTSEYYEYAEENAVADGYKGTLLRFSKVTEYQGASTLPQPGTAPNGYTVSYFYNGEPHNHENNEVDDYSFIEGNLYRKEVYKTDSLGDQLISSVDSEYEVAVEIATDPQEVNLEPIHGGILQVSSAASMQEGVETTATNTYSKASGNILSTHTSYYDSTGQEVEVAQTTVYAYSISDYIGLWYQNNLALVAETSTSNTRDSTSALVSSQVQTYKLWDTSPDPDVPDQWGTWKAYVAYNDSPDPFTWWTGVSEPGPGTNGWIKTNDVISRNEQGGVITYKDIEGIPTTSFYDESGTFSLATFANATFEDGISYTSFEGYQVNPWTQSIGTGYITLNDTFIGKQCYEMSATQSTSSVLSQTIEVDNADQYYCFNLWYKTLNDADSANEITLSISEASSSAPQTVTLPLTEGQWKPFQWSVNLANLWPGGPVPSSAVILTLNISLVVPSSSLTEYLRIDHVVFTPILSPYAGTVYDLNKLRTLGNIAADGNNGKVLFNETFNAEYTAIGPYNQTTALGTSSSVRQLASYDPNGSFPQDFPNFSLSVNGRDQGFYDQFMSSESLDNYSSVEGSLTDWIINNNSLQIDSSGATFNLIQVDAVESVNLSAYLSITPSFTSTESNPQQTMCLGITNTTSTPSRFYVKWNAPLEQWQLMKWSGSGSTYTAIGTFNTGDVHNEDVKWQPEWLLTIVEDRLIFTANGILIYNYQDSDIAASKHTIILGIDDATTTGQGLVSFQNLTILEDIQMSLGYSDGLGRPLQSMVVESSDSVIMTPAVYDSLGRSEASFLSSRIVNGSHGITNPFAFDKDFVNNAYRTTLDNIWDGYPVAGNITNYHTDGYPFSRVLNEPSPLGRPIESGQPGVEFAITYGGNTHITTYSYEALTTTIGDPGFWYELPTTGTSPHYFVTTSIDPDGKKTVQYTTANKELVGTINYDAAGMNPIKSSQVHDIRGQVIGIIPPNYYQQNTPNQTTPFNPGPTPTPAYASSFKYDFWGRQIETYYPDSGTQKFIYDDTGRPRFTQDANGAVANDYFNYVKYDILGRDIEEGVYTDTTAWDQATIAHANDRAWPSTNNTASNTTLYDIDNTTGANTTSLTFVGRQWQNTTYNGSSGDTADITNTYTYRITGEILTNTQQASYNGTPDTAYTTTNDYTINGRLLSTTDDTTNVVTSYAVNMLGQTTEVTVSTSGITPKTVKTTYTYDQKGNVATMDILDPTGSSLTTKTYSYLPNNWIAGMSDSYVAQDLKYTSDNCLDEGYYNGSLSHNTVTYPGVTTPTPPPSDYCYTVDQLNRVITANNDGDTDYSWTFDNNSNFVTHTIDSGTPVIRTYNTATSANQLTSITGDPGFLRNFTYDANGNLTEMTDGATPTPNTLTTFTYNNWNDKARVIAKPQTNIESVFDYDPDDLQYRKRIYDTTSGSTLTETILNPGGLEIRFNASGTATQTLANIAVPGVGLVYRLENDTFYWIMPDHLGSTRMIVDETGTVQDLYNYEVYGSPTKTNVNISALVYSNLYTGQYYDEELELYNYHARFYDPTIARFLQIDPAHEFYNPYSYVGGVPNLATDPSGMRSWDAGSIGALIAGIFATVAAVGLTIASFGAGSPLIASSVFYTGTVIGVVGGFGSSAISYAGNNAYDFNADAFGVEVGLGTAFGLIGGITGGGIAASTALSNATKLVVDLATASLLSGFQGLFTSAATNAANGITGSDAFEGGGENFGIALGIGVAISVGSLLAGRAINRFITQRGNRQVINNILDEIEKYPNNAGYMRITVPKDGKASQNIYTTKNGRGTNSVKLVNNNQGRRELQQAAMPERDFGDTLYAAPQKIGDARYNAAFSDRPSLENLNVNRYDPEVLLARKFYEPLGIKVPRQIRTPQQIREFHKGLVKMQRKAFSQRKNWMIISSPQNAKRTQVSYV